MNMKKNTKIAITIGIVSVIGIGAGIYFYRRNRMKSSTKMKSQGDNKPDKNIVLPINEMTVDRNPIVVGNQKGSGSGKEVVGATPLNTRSDLVNNLPLLLRRSTVDNWIKENLNRGKIRYKSSAIGQYISIGSCENKYRNQVNTPESWYECADKERKNDLSKPLSMRKYYHSTSGSSSFLGNMQFELEENKMDLN